jgi:cyanophycinase
LKRRHYYSIIGEATDAPWVARLLSAAERHARRRGDRVLTGDHLALCLARPDATVEPLLRRAGVDPLEWRDEIVTVLGWREGAAAAHAGRPAGSMADSPADRRFDGAMETGSEVEVVLQLAAAEAAANGTEVRPEHVMAALLLDGESVGAATASWLGLTTGKVRAAAGLVSRRRVVADGNPPGPFHRAPTAGPLVLCGGAPDRDLYQDLIRLVRAAGAGFPKVVVVDVGSSRPRRNPPSTELLDDFKAAGAAEAVDSGLSGRPTAGSEEVCERISSADVVWFCGGDPAVIYDGLWATPALEAIEHAHAAGALLGGVSAGATIWGIGTISAYVTGDPEPLPLFAALPGIVVMAHYWPTRQATLRERVRAFPGSRGIGVAHGGAVVVGPALDEIHVLRAGPADTANVALAGPDAVITELPPTAADARR